MKVSLKFFFIFLLVIGCWPETEEDDDIYCGLDSSSIEFDSSVIIGDQKWATTNLNVRTFRNGDSIPFISSISEWEACRHSKKPACCYYNNDSLADKAFGLIYNWWAVDDPRGLAPEGWHVPDTAEWRELIETLGGSEVAGKAMRHDNGWSSLSGKLTGGTNESGFSALPTKLRNQDGRFFKGCSEAVWWSSTASHHQGEAYGMWCTYSDFAKLSGSGRINEEGRSVRCIKD